MATRDGLVATCYSHEFRSPPVPLVALIGCPEFHKPLSEFFLHSLKPPLVSLCCNEPVEQFVPRAFSAPGSGHHAAAGQLAGKGTPGILKADWLIKHRQRRPAVALVIVHRHEMQGDPNTWNRMLYTLKFIRDAVTPRGAGMVVAVAQPAGMGELPGDRLQTVCHHLSLDPRSVVMVTMEDPSQPLDEPSRASRDAALHSVGLLASEQCAAYYARRAKHVSDKHSERRAMHPDGRCPPEMNARTAIKLAVYAEFRQDWRAAVNEYQAAYSHVRAIIAPPPPTPSTSTSGSGGLHASHSMPHVPNALNPLEAGARSDAYPPSPYPSVQQQQQQSPYPSSTLEPPSYGTDQGPGASSGPRKPPHHAHHASWGANAWNGAMSPSPQQYASTGWPTAHPLSVQRFAQAARVSELLQLKLVILLAYRERLEEAAAQANSHIQFFMRPPVTLAPAAASAHAGYLIRQLQVTAEVLSSKLEGSPLAAAAKECNRATLLTSAAQVAVDRRRLLDTLASVRASQPTLDMTLVKKGPYVGTITLRMDGGTRELSDQEFLLWLEAEELRMHGLATGGSGSTGGASGTQASSPSVGVQTGLAGGAGTAVEVINAALQALSTGHTDRQRSQLVMLLAEEHVLLGSLSAARKLLLQAAHTYRRDGWGVPLAQALLLLREAAQRLRLPTEHVMYCLELSVVIATLTQADLQALSQSCSARGLTVPAAEPLGAAAVNALLTGVHDIARLPGIIKTSRGPSPEPGQSPGPPGGAQAPAPRAFNYTVEWVDLLAVLSRKAPGPGTPLAAGTRQGPGGGGAADGQRPPTMADLLQRHHQQDFGWSRVLGCAVSFPADTAPDAPCADLHVALLNTLAFTLPLTGADVTLADELAGHWTVPLLTEPLQPDTPACQPPAPPTHGPTDPSSRGSHPHHGDTDHHMDQPRHAHHKHHAGTDTWEENTKVNGHASSRAGGDDTATSDGVARALALTHLGNASHLLPSGPMRPLDLPLHAGAWTRLATRVAPRGVGRLRVDKLTVYIGQYTSVTFMVSSFPSGPPGHVSLGGCMERLHGIDALQLCPFAHVMHMGQLAGPSINIQHVGPLPTLQLSMQPGGPAYVGEPFFIAATVTVTHGLPTSVMEFAVRPLTPGMQPSHLSIMVDDRANLERYHGQDLARLQLLSVAPGASHTARLWVVARHAGRVALAVTLQCPALVTEVVEFNVEEPLSINVHLTADPANHVLVPPAAPGPPGGPAPPQPLTIGQQSLAHLALRHAATAPDAAEIELLEAQVIGNPSSGVTPLAELSDQLLNPDGSPLLSLNKGDVALLLAPLLPAALTPAPASLGNVQVTWRRTHRRVSGPAHPSGQPHPSLQTMGQTSVPQAAKGGLAGPPGAAAEGSAQPGMVVEPTTAQQATAVRVALTADQLDELASQQPRPSNKVVSRLELPPVLVQEALLSARTLSPGQATAGIAFTFVCQVQNFGASQQELLVALLDAPGFVLSGDRSQQVVVPSRQAGGAVTVSWLLVAHTAGQLSLPSVRIAAPRHNATLTTQPGSVHVLPF